MTTVRAPRSSAKSIHFPATTSPRSCCRRRSQSEIIGLANAGGDTINSIKQASEFGIVPGPEAGWAVDLHHGYPCTRAQNRALFQQPQRAFGCIFGYVTNLLVDYDMTLRYKLLQPRSSRGVF